MPGAPVAASQIRPTTVHVDLGRLRRNFLAVKNLVGPRVRVLAAVKGDAYGHGAAPCALALQEAGCDAFGVALVEEGKALRQAGVRGEILCLGGVGPDGAEEAVSWSLTPVVYDLETAERLDRVGRARGSPVGVHLKVDTGMGRLGVPPGEWETFLDRLADFSSLRAVGLLTHFSDAEDPDPTFTREQFRRFMEAVAAARTRDFRPRWLHCANSAAALAHPEMRLDMVRVGLALYGVAPRPAPDLELAQVMSVSTRVLFVKNVAPSCGVSYGRTWRSRGPARIATLPVGYADGYPRALSNRAQVVLRGHRCPLRGAVCMDMVMVDVTAVPAEVRPGDPVELMGDDVGAVELAVWARTIPYEVLCGFSERVPRRFGGRDG